MNAVLILFLVSGMACSGLASGRMLVDDHRGGGYVAPATMQAGKVVAIHAAAGKIVIDGVTYAYSPATTVVRVEGKPGTMSDLKSGNSVYFQAQPGSQGRQSIVTSIEVRKK